MTVFNTARWEHFVTEDTLRDRDSAINSATRRKNLGRLYLKSFLWLPEQQTMASKPLVISSPKKTFPCWNEGKAKDDVLQACWDEFSQNSECLATGVRQEGTNNQETSPKGRSHDRNDGQHQPEAIEIRGTL